MANPSKDKGTRAETAVARYLQAHGWPHAERRAPNGSTDRGDITGCPGLVFEVKYRDHEPRDGEITAWMAETETERANAGADIGVLIARRPSYPVASWWAIARIGDLMALRNPSTPREMRVIWPVRMLLADMVTVLRMSGYGDPLEVPHGNS